MTGLLLQDQRIIRIRFSRSCPVSSCLAVLDLVLSCPIKYIVLIHGDENHALANTGGIELVGEITKR